MNEISKMNGNCLGIVWGGERFTGNWIWCRDGSGRSGSSTVFQHSQKDTITNAAFQKNNLNSLIVARHIAIEEMLNCVLYFSIIHIRKSDLFFQASY